MKKNPLIAVSTLLLAGVALYASKAHKLTSNITRYYCTSFPTVTVATKCVPYAAANWVYDPSGVFICQFTKNGKTYTLYTRQASAATAKFCTVGQNLTACTVPLYYTTPQ